MHEQQHDLLKLWCDSDVQMQPQTIVHGLFLTGTAGRVKTDVDIICHVTTRRASDVGTKNAASFRPALAQRPRVRRLPLGPIILGWFCTEAQTDWFCELGLTGLGFSCLFFSFFFAVDCPMGPGPTLWVSPRSCWICCICTVRRGLTI